MKGPGEPARPSCLADKILVEKAGLAVVLRVKSLSIGEWEYEVGPFGKAGVRTRQQERSLRHVHS